MTNYDEEITKTEEEVRECNRTQSKLITLWSEKLNEFYGFETNRDGRVIDRDYVGYHSPEKSKFCFRATGLYLYIAEDDANISISTSGYSGSLDTSDFKEARVAARNVERAFSVIDSRKEVFAKLDETYKEEVLGSAEYIEASKNIEAGWTKVTALKKERDEAVALKREQDNASKRIVGTMLKRIDRNWTYLALVTHITPTKVKIETVQVYCVDDAAKSLEYLQKNKKRFIDEKYGEFVKNENMTDWEIITN